VVGISEKDWDRLAQEKLDAESKRQAEEDEQHALGILPLNDRLPEHDDYTGVIYRMKWRYRGGRHYELSNHLGNVQVVVTDKKIAHSSGGVDWAYYTADVLSAHDQYAFGQDMEERSFERAPEKGYRYGMNGQEKDDDVASGVFAAQYWEYDSRTGRRWNVDPIVKNWESSYACFNNNPLLFKDPNGLDGIASVNKEKKTISITQKIYYDKTDENFKNKAISDDKYISSLKETFKSEFSIAQNNFSREKWKVKDENDKDWTVSVKVEFIGLEGAIAVDKAVKDDPTSNKLVFNNTLENAGEYNPNTRTITTGANRRQNDRGSTLTHEIGHGLGLPHAYEMKESGLYGDIGTTTRNGQSACDEEKFGIMSYAPFREVKAYEIEFIARGVLTTANSTKANEVDIHISGSKNEGNKIIKQ
jgi:RHS repeat-associated protein